MASVACGTTFFWSSSCGRKNESGRITGTSREASMECAYIIYNDFIFIRPAMIPLLFISASSVYIYSLMCKISFPSRSVTEPLCRLAAFRLVRHLAEKQLLTLGYPPLTGRPFLPLDRRCTNTHGTIRRGRFEGLYPLLGLNPDIGRGLALPRNCKKLRKTAATKVILDVVAPPPRHHANRPIQDKAEFEASISRTAWIVSAGR